MIDVQIIDDHRLLTEGIVRTINESGVAYISAVYHNINDCKQRVVEKKPDVLLLDIILPDGNGIEFCKDIKKTFPDIQVLMISSLDELSIVRRCLHHGASGYVLKNIMSEELVSAIQRVHENEIFLSKEFQKLTNSTKEDDSIIWLTKREKEVLRLIAEGKSNPEIAELLFLSPKTIKGYRKDLLIKFNANNSVTLIKKAIELQFL